MSCYLSTPFLGVDLASIINFIATDSPSPLSPPTYIDITGEFPYVLGGGKPSSKLDKQVTIVCLNLQYIQQSCCGLIVNVNYSFCLKIKVNFQIYLNERDQFKSTFKPTPNH